MKLNSFKNFFSKVSTFKNIGLSENYSDKDFRGEEQLFDKFNKISDLYEKIIQKNGSHFNLIDSVKVLDLWVNFIKKDDNHVGYNLKKYGFWEPEVTLWMIKNVKEGENCIDVGSNYGYFTQLLSYLVGSNGSIFSFEPNIELYKLSKLSDYTNVLFSSKPNNVAFYNKALGRKEEYLYLEVDDSNPGGAGVSKTQNHTTKNKVYSVQCNSLDNFNLDKKIDFFKIDIEGGEEDCFIGGIKTLSNCRAGVMELGDYHRIEFLNELLKYFNFYKIKNDLNEEAIDVNYIKNIYEINNSHFANIILRRKNI